MRYLLHSLPTPHSPFHLVPAACLAFLASAPLAADVTLTLRGLPAEFACPGRMVFQVDAPGAKPGTRVYIAFQLGGDNDLHLSSEVVDGRARFEYPAPAVPGPTPLVLVVQAEGADGFTRIVQLRPAAAEDKAFEDKAFEDKAASDGGDLSQMAGVLKDHMVNFLGTKDQGRLARTSRAWRNRVASVARHITVDAAMTDDDLVGIVARYERIESMTIQAGSRLTGPRMAETLGRMVHLKSLEVIGSHDFTGAGLPEGLRSLRVLECDAFTGAGLPRSLRSLRVRLCPAFTGVGLHAGMQRLEVSLCRLFTGTALPANLTHLDVANCPGVTGVVALPDTLEYLYLQNLRATGFTGLAHPTTLAHLGVFGCAAFPPDRVLAVVRKAPKLQVLECVLDARILDSASPGLLEIRGTGRDFQDRDLARFPKLRALDLSDSSITGRTLPPSLRTLRLRHCPSFEGVFLRNSALETLFLWDCPLVEPQDLPPSLHKLWLKQCPKFTWKDLVHILDHHRTLDDVAFFGLDPKDPNLEEQFRHRAHRMKHLYVGRDWKKAGFFR